MDELNAHLQGACEAHGRRQAHPEYPDRSVYEVFEEERAKLIPYVEDFDSWCQTVASVSKCLLVNFDCNRYSVDVSAAGLRFMPIPTGWYFVSTVGSSVTIIASSSVAARYMSLCIIFRCCRSSRARCKTVRRFANGDCLRQCSRCARDWHGSRTVTARW